MTNVTLKGNEYILTKDMKQIYRVSSGKAVVYLVHVSKHGIPGRRYYLAEFGEMASLKTIPSLNIVDEDLEEWCFLITAIGSVDLVETICDSEVEILILKNQLAQNLSIKNQESISEVDSEIFEYVQRIMVTEEVSIIKERQQLEKSKQELYHSVINIFHKGARREILSKNPLYEAIKVVCKTNAITLANYEQVVEYFGKQFSIEEMARFSNFIVREIKLEDGWYKANCGSLILFKERGASCNPVACIWTNGNHYVEYEFLGDKYTSNIVDRKTAESYVSSGYVINKAFPQKSLGIWDLFRFVCRQISTRAVVIYSLLSLLGTIIMLSIPFLNQLLYDHFLLVRDCGNFIKIGVVLLSIAIANLLFTITRNLVCFRIENEVEISLYHAFIHRLFHLPVGEYQKYESADLIKRIYEIPKIIVALIGKAIMTGVLIIYVVVLYFVIYSYSPKMTKAGLILSGINIIVSISIGGVTQAYTTRLIPLKARGASIIYQSIMGIDKIKNANADDQILCKYFESYIERKKYKSKLNNLERSCKEIQILISSITLVVFYLFVYRGGHITIGRFLCFNSMYQLFSLYLYQVVDFFIDCIKNTSMFKAIKPILKFIPEKTENVKSVSKISGKIEVSHVSFAYEGSNKKVLDDVSFSIKKGEYIGIVGGSGSGKSTLLKVLLGFEKVESGNVYYDDLDLDLLNKIELRRLFGVVLQEGQLFPASIFDNIVVTSTAVTNEERKKELDRVWKVMDIIGLSDDVENMPMGVQTIVSDGQSTISGGQKQRILIARAIYGNPSILFFDEATSALDNKTQRMVADNLKQLNITRVVIAHRLSTIKDCDRILVLNQGKIVETGTYHSLMEKRGYFYRLAKRQIC